VANPNFRIQSLDFDAATGDLYGLVGTGPGFGFSLLRWDSSDNLLSTMGLASGFDAISGADLTVHSEIQPSPVPEPSSLALLGMGVISMIGYGWRRKRKLVV
jgi:hypothetical protein